MRLDIIFNCMAKPKRNCGIRNGSSSDDGDQKSLKTMTST